jgi:hypothetical protein
MEGESIAKVEVKREGAAPSNEVAGSPRLSRRSLVVLAQVMEGVTLPLPAMTARVSRLGTPLEMDLRTTERPNSLPSVPPPVPVGTPSRRFTVRIRSIFTCSSSKRQGKPNKNNERIAAYHIVCALSMFTLTAILCTSSTSKLTPDISLSLSLPTFSNYLHVFFIGILFIELCYVIRSVLRKYRATEQRKKETMNGNAPPPGAVIHGASNWENIPGEHSLPAGFDLESIGVTEALKPIPPAYGIYRGSVRIADSDLRCVAIEATLIVGG